MTNRQNNWKTEWYDWMRIAARDTINRFRWMGTIDEDELINEAWLNSVRRMSPGVEKGLLIGCSKLSMRQYLIGGGRTRLGKVRDMERRTQSLYNKEGNVIAGMLMSSQNNAMYSYDDVDDLKHCLQRYDTGLKRLILLLITGKKQREIAEIYKVSESSISVQLKPFLIGLKVK